MAHNCVDGCGGSPADRIASCMPSGLGGLLLVSSHQIPSSTDGFSWVRQVQQYGNLRHGLRESLLPHPATERGSLATQQCCHQGFEGHMTSVRQRHKDMTTGRKIRLNVLSRSVYSSPGGFKPESLRSVSEQFGQP